MNLVLPGVLWIVFIAVCTLAVVVLVFGWPIRRRARKGEWEAYFAALEADEAIMSIPVSAMLRRPPTRFILGSRWSPFDKGGGPRLVLEDGRIHVIAIDRPPHTYFDYVELLPSATTMAYEQVASLISGIDVMDWVCLSGKDHGMLEVEVALRPEEGTIEQLWNLLLDAGVAADVT